MTKYDEKQKERILKYAKEKLKRVPLDLPLDYYNQVKAAADASGSSLNGFIKTAINEKMDRMK